MFKFVTIYRRVDDMVALEEFFSGTHLPLAEQLPGLLRSEVGRIRGKPGGNSTGGVGGGDGHSAACGSGNPRRIHGD